MVDGLFAGTKEEGGRLGVGSSAMKLCPVLVQCRIGEAAGVLDQVELQPRAVDVAVGKALLLHRLVEDEFTVASVGLQRH